jgi:hypothetical protein
MSRSRELVIEDSSHFRNAGLVRYVSGAFQVKAFSDVGQTALFGLRLGFASPTFLVFPDT